MTIASRHEEKCLVPRRAIRHSAGHRTWYRPPISVSTTSRMITPVRKWPSMRRSAPLKAPHDQTFEQRNRARTTNWALPFRPDRKPGFSEVGDMAHAERTSACAKLRNPSCCRVTPRPQGDQNPSARRNSISEHCDDQISHGFTRRHLICCSCRSRQAHLCGIVGRRIRLIASSPRCAEPSATSSKIPHGSHSVAPNIMVWVNTFGSIASRPLFCCHICARDRIFQESAPRFARRSMVISIFASPWRTSDCPTSRLLSELIVAAAAPPELLNDVWIHRFRRHGISILSILCRENVKISASAHGGHHELRRPLDSRRATRP